MNKSGAYLDMERDYVTAPPGDEGSFTITAIAGRYGRAKSSVARMSRLKDWKAKRAAYRGNTSEIVSELDSDAYATRLHKIHGDFVEAAEETMAAYRAAVRSGDVKPTAGDVEKMVKLVREIVSKPAGGGEENGSNDGIRISESLGRELLGTIESVARQRLERGSAAGAAEPKLVSSGADGRLQVR